MVEAVNGNAGRLGWFVAVLVASLAGSVQAHRLDECLQAARIQPGAATLRLELDLAPGVDVLPRFLAMIDVDRDGTISAAEGEAYADLVMRDLLLELDGRTRRLSVEGSQFPPMAELSDGTGRIRLVFTATFPSLRSGRHRIRFLNRHRRDMSVYLSNALVPEEAGVVVSRQRRSVDQAEIRIEFLIRPPLTRR